MKENINYFLENLGETGFRVLCGIAVLFFGIVLIKITVRAVRRGLRKTSTEKTVASFSVSILYFALYVLLIYLTLSVAVPDVSAGLIAILGSAALAVGLALKDSLIDFAGGIRIIFTKPFREGDYVGAGGTEGTVEKIGLLNTVLLSVDGKKIVLSNSKIVSDTVTDYSELPLRRVDLTFFTSYEASADKVRECLLSVARAEERILQSPSPTVYLKEQARDRLIYSVRLWTKTENYWDVYFSYTEKAVSELSKTGFLSSSYSFVSEVKA